MKKLLFTILFILSMITTGFSLNMDENWSGGQARVYWTATTPAAADVIVFAVGTAMSRDSYDDMSNELTKYGYVVVVVDTDPGAMVKSDKNKFRNCALYIKANLLSWLYGTSVTSIKHWIMGGHSAGGQGAQGAISADVSLADAMFSVDPYNASNEGNVSVPGLYWGFNVTTCFVTVNDAGKKGYYKNVSNKRAFFRVNKVYSWGPCGYSPKWYHCSIADGSCPACTNCMYTPSSFYADVAKSADKFIKTAFYGVWVKSNLTWSSSGTPGVLYEGYDQP